MVSADNFSIVPGDAQVQVNERGAELQDNDLGRSRDKGKEGKRNPGPSGREANASSARAGANARMTDIKTSANSTAGSKSATKTFSASPAGGTYYIYSFDGRLLAEYNLYGTCVRDYIYFGGRLIAEFDAVGSQIYYYTQDQINSTRIVTNGTGAVVYAAAHDPYGGIQQTWPGNTFNPTPKFSGKERDGESDLDYFGARYYDHSIFRYLSVDSASSAQLGQISPQFLNSYSYCGNNPIRYYDPDGRQFLIFLRGPGILFLFDCDGNFVGAWNSSNRPAPNRPDAHAYPEGYWPFVGYRCDTTRPGTDSCGFYGFDVQPLHPGDEEGAMGVHTLLGEYTAGCIGTKTRAMQEMNRLTQSGDRMWFIVVVWDDIDLENPYPDIENTVNHVAFLMRAGGHGERLVNTVCDALRERLMTYYGVLSFTFDYFFSGESPIPGNI